MPTVAEPAGRIDTIAREDFLAELGKSLRPGDHLSTIGPTGRGKSTLIGQLIPRLEQFDDVAILSPKGRDPAYAALGHPTRVWPPKRTPFESFRVAFGLVDDRVSERPRIWRVETPVPRNMRRDPAAIRPYLLKMRDSFGAVLMEPVARPENAKRSLFVVVDDSRMVCDPRMLDLASPVTMGLIVGRSKKVSMVNNFQAPRWVPREGLDQITHALIWRNRDRDVVKRLGEISGDLDLKLIEAAIGRLDYHACLWIDGRADRVLIVRDR